MFLFILNRKPDSFQKKLFVKDFRPGACFSKVPKLFGRISGDIILSVSVPRQLSYQTNWELVICEFMITRLRWKSINNARLYNF